MKRNCIAVFLLSTALKLFSQSHNDYMGGNAVSGATDYYFQWIIIIVGFVFIVYIILLLLGVYYKQKDKEQEILNEFHRVQNENWIKKDELSPFQGVVSSKHILTVYSDEPIVINKYKNGELLSSKVGYYSIDNVTFDETEDTHIDDVLYYNPEEIIKEFNNTDFEYKIEAHEENAIGVSYEFIITERFLPPLLNPKGVKLIKFRLNGQNHEYLYLFETIDYMGKQIQLKEL